MSRGWYPAALSLTLVACGGNVDDGRPSATGGAPQFHYGPNVYVGGAGGVDTGKPLAIGGRGAGAAGANAGLGGEMTTGGSATIDAGTPSTGGYQPILIYMANLRLPPKDCTDETRKYYARPFEPRRG